MVNKSLFKKRLDEIRKEQMISIEDQARAIGISRPTLDVLIDESSTADFKFSTQRKIHTYISKYPQQEANDNN